jgi:hypothetical protein
MPETQNNAAPTQPTPEQVEQKAREDAISAVVRSLMFPFLLSREEAKKVLTKLIFSTPASMLTVVSNQVLAKLSDLHESALRYLVFLHDSGGIYLDSEDNMAAFMEYITESNSDFDILGIRETALNPKYLEFLFKLPKPFTRIHNMKENFHELETYDQITLHIKDKIQQLDYSLWRMGIKNMTPTPKPAPMYWTIMASGYNNLRNYADNVFGLFTRSVAKNAVVTEEIAQRTNTLAIT